MIFISGFLFNRDPDFCFLTIGKMREVAFIKKHIIIAYRELKFVIRYWVAFLLYRLRTSKHFWEITLLLEVLLQRRIIWREIAIHKNLGDFGPKKS